MDLLRLVLAKQPLAKLVMMRKLIGNDTFLQVRMDSINRRRVPVPENGKEWYLRYCTLEGELWQKSFFHVDLQLLRLRAIFLRYQGGFKQFRDYRIRDFLMWKYLESDIPEIQARALVQVFLDAESGNHDEVKHFMSLHKDLTIIHWTPQLKQVISNVLRSSLEDIDHRVMFLAGFLHLRRRHSTWDEFYLSGYLTSFTNGDTTETKIPECEDAIKRSFPGMNAQDQVNVIALSGYINFSYSESWAGRYALDRGYQYARLPLLRRYISNFKRSAGSGEYDRMRMLLGIGQIEFNAPDDYISKKLVLRVRKILDNETIVSQFPAKAREDYEIIAGNISLPTDNEDGTNLRVLIGNKPEGYQFNIPIKSYIGSTTFQASVVYDPLYSFYESTEGIGRHVGYQRGLGVFMENYIDPSDSLQSAGGMGNPEIARLVGVRDDTEKSTKHEEAYRKILKMLTS